MTIKDSFVNPHHVRVSCDDFVELHEKQEVQELESKNNVEESRTTQVNLTKSTFFILNPKQIWN